jgi:hypothetical protein
MPLDPSIVSNAFANAANNMPDVNALMNQRVRGAENIYQIETARQAQAAEDAKAAAKAQEDAAIKALLPAYAHALKTGDMKGALSLAPPEYQDGLTPYVEALDGKPIEEIQAALTGSLVTSEVGRAFLENQARMTTAGIQQGQLDVSRGNLAIEKAKLAQGPEGSYSTVKGGDGKMYIMNTKTGEMRPAKADDGTAITSESAAVEGLDPKTKAKFDQAYPQAVRNLQSSTTELDKDIADVQALINDEEGLNAITGVFNANTPNISAASRRAQALYDKIRAGAGFSALQAMRDASPTGGALGNVSNQEGAKLEQSVAAFAQNQDADDLRKALRDYLIDLKVAQENVRAAFDETYSYRGAAPSSDIATQTRERRTQMERDVNKTTLPPGVTVKKRN